MKLGKVILDIQTNSLSKPFSYLIQDDNDESMQGFGVNKQDLLSKFDFADLDINKHKIDIGSIVVVPFGNQFRCGFLLDITDVNQDSQYVNPNKLKPILCALTKSFFSKDKVDFARYISDKYIAPFATSLRLFIPPGVSAKTYKRGNFWRVKLSETATVDTSFVVKGKNYDDFVPRDNAVKQKQILSVLKSGQIKLTELRHEYGSIDQAVKSLKKAGAIDIVKQRKIRSNFSEFSYAHDENVDFILTDGQKQALEIITPSIESGNDDVFVVDGVTGSGKTEVYLRAIEKVLELGKNACVLVPEISLTPQTVARFRARFGDNIAVLHSKMSTGERFDQWDCINDGRARVVIGARSALFSPVNNLGLIVIDEEHETSYKQDNNPRYDARTCAVYLAKQSKCPLILGSATPSLESLYKCKHLDNWHRVVLSERTNKKPMPNIYLVDMGNEFKGGHKSLFSVKLAHDVKEELSKGNKVVLFHNRRGFSSYTFCRSCGFTPQCLNCSTSLTYHQRLKVETMVNGMPTSAYQEMLVCHHCGHMQHNYVACPECGSPYIAKYGAGTQNVEDQLNAIVSELPNYKDINIVRMDADTTRAKYGHQKCLEEFAKPGPAVLLGTQMIAKGLDFENITLVGVVLIDTNLAFPDFRSSERTHNLILQVAGRAGRADLPGKVIVQTYAPDTDCIKYAARYDRNAFIQSEMLKRKMLNYPPYSNMVNILVSGHDDEKTQNYANNMYLEIKDCLSIIDDGQLAINKPTKCLLSKIRGRFRYHIQIKCKQDKLHDILKPYFVNLKKDNDIVVFADVDPINML